MAMPKKGSRSIAVDEIPYRFRMRGNWDGNITVAVEPVTDDGLSLLTVDTSTSPALSHIYREIGITPAVVEAYIRLALGKGWKPTEKGNPFVLVADAAMATGKT